MPWIGIETNFSWNPNLASFTFLPPVSTLRFIQGFISWNSFILLSQGKKVPTRDLSQTWHWVLCFEHKNGLELASILYICLFVHFITCIVHLFICSFDHSSVWSIDYLIILSFDHLFILIICLFVCLYICSLCSFVYLNRLGRHFHSIIVIFIFITIIIFYYYYFNIYYIISVRFHGSKPIVQEFPLLHGVGEEISILLAS